ncbi:MAG: HAMP domain-containing protein [Candidatus Schekmanbacteria bacterium]|nr:HAMP domain-containing protein [Candidatus Schekmanbacteria bacterium]
MRRLPLSLLLAAIVAGLVLSVLACIVPAGLGILEELAVENARTRVELAATSAAEGATEYATEAETGARLLAERPTLLGLVAAGESAPLGAFLERFRLTAGLAGCAIVRGGVAVAATPGPIPWSELGQVEGRQYRTLGARAAAVVAVAALDLELEPQARAVVVRWLDDQLTARLSARLGLPVRLELGLAAAETSGPPDAFVARRTLGGSPEAPVRVVVALSRSEVSATLRPLRRTFFVIALGTAAVAAALGVYAGHSIALPLRALGEAAERIGAGDLVTPIRPGRGAEVGALAGRMEDMRQRLRSLTAELRRREEEAQALLGNMVEGVFAVDAERRIQYLNAQGAALLGVEAAAARGRSCGDVLRALNASGARPCEDECPIVHARSRGSSRAVEHLHLAQGERTVVITSAPPSGSTQVQIIRDETDIEAARRARDAVLASVSHELKTPLTAQLASIELLRDGLRSMPTASAEQLVGAMERSTLRLVRLVDNLLESVRIETGKTALRRVPVDLEVVVEEAAAMTRPLLDQRGQTLSVELPEPPLEIAGDPGQLVQVLVNVLANANKFGPDGSTIRVGGERSGGWLSVWVDDMGPGVPASQSSSIFGQFQRLGGAKAAGMGLGLWIAKSLVERHGGHLGVSASPQGGARFTLTFPRGGAA